MFNAFREGFNDAIEIIDSAECGNQQEIHHFEDELKVKRHNFSSLTKMTNQEARQEAARLAGLGAGMLRELPRIIVQTLTRLER